ncbi:MAG: DNA-directed RNA polymerase subunit D [Nanoarchaeota archaeon]|nr:DNA-directed RNA polymerase subunit D [Nanoarchaeota archaeon]
MKLIEKKENAIIFSTEIEESLANAIRRYLNQIPVLAVEEVEISKNDSSLYDETIAHRIGLIPLKTEKSMKDKTSIELTLNGKEGIIFSKELTGKAHIVYDQIPITILNKGQKLELTAIAKLGKGEKHSKFSPGLMFYQNIVDIKIEKNCPAEIVNSCPKQILKVKDGKIIVEGSENCDICESCLKSCKKHGKDFIQINPTKDLKITLESFGQLEVKDIFSKAINLLKKDLSEIAKKVK